MSAADDEEDQGDGSDELYARLSAGDESALGPLREKNDHLVMARAKKVLATKDNDIARDVAQRVWVRIITKQAVFGGKCKFRSWLLAVATRVCLEERRDRKKRDASPVENVGARSSDYSRKDLEHDVTKALTTLSDEERELIRLRMNEDATFKEIAVKTGIPEATVRRRLAEAFAKLRGRLPGYGPRD